VAMHGTVLYDAELLRRSGGFDPGLASCEDYDVYLRLARDHPIAAYPAIAAEYRRHGHSLSRNALRMIATSHQVIDRHATTPEEHVLATQGKAVMMRYYGDMFWWAVLRNLRRRKLGAVIASLGEFLRAPHLWRSLGSVGVSLLVSLTRRSLSRRA
jgi:hypothetical protein